MTFCIFTDLAQRFSWCIMQWNCMTVSFPTLLASSWSKFARPCCLPTIDGTPSVVIPESFDKGKPRRLIVFITASNKSMPLVLPFIGTMAASSSVTSKSSSTPPTKSANWAVDLTSVLSSSAKEYDENFRAFAIKVSSIEFPSSSTRRVMVCLDRLILANVSFFSGHMTSAIRTMHSLMNSPSANGFDFYAIISATK